MSLSHQLSNAIQIATQRHDGQFDKCGQPYILHCLKVMHYVQSDDLEVKAIAVMHDLIEDTFGQDEKGIHDGTVFLIHRGFSDRVVDGVLAMTKRDGQSFADYKDQVKSNKDAILVKMADLRHNTDIRRIKGLTKKDFDRTARYHEFYAELETL